MAAVLSIGRPEAGWMIFRLEDGATQVTWRASYLSDSFANLIEAVTTALSGESARAVFVIEPGCVVMDLQPMADRLSLDLVEHADWPPGNAAGGESLGRFDLRLRTFAGALLDAAKGLADAYESGFQRAFPEKALADLATALKAR